jgi:hypothetical protein
VAAVESSESVAESVCPRCGRPGVPVLWGRIGDPSLGKAARTKQIAVGGCRVPAGPRPNWSCPRRHLWRDDSDEAGWRRRVERAREGARKG